MRERILKTLEAYLLINEDVLEEEQIKDIKEQIQAVREYKEKTFISVLKDKWKIKR